MAYQTGSINSFAELLTKMSVFATANGWQEEISGDVRLFKSGRCHVRFELYDGVSSEGAETEYAYSGLKMSSGTGSDGSANLAGQPPSDFEYNYYKTDTLDTRYGVNTRNVFPLRYNFHAMTAPVAEFFVVLEDDFHRTSDRSSLIHWLGFGEFEAVGGGENGFYAISCAKDTDNLSYPHLYASTGGSALFSNGNFPIIPFKSPHALSCHVIYDTTIGDEWKIIGGPYTSAATGLRMVTSSNNGLSVSARWDDSASEAINSPLLYPFSFHVVSDPARRGRDYDDTIFIGSPSIIRQVELTFTESGEVINDGAEDWVCYAALQRDGDNTPDDDGRRGSYFHGFALRKGS